jgi:hypothetical protein
MTAYNKEKQGGKKDPGHVVGNKVGLNYSYPLNIPRRIFSNIY